MSYPRFIPIVLIVFNSLFFCHYTKAYNGSNGEDYSINVCSGETTTYFFYVPAEIMNAPLAGKKLEVIEYGLDYVNGQLTRSASPALTTEYTISGIYGVAAGTYVPFGGNVKLNGHGTYILEMFLTYANGVPSRVQTISFTVSQPFTPNADWLSIDNTNPYFEEDFTLSADIPSDALSSTTFSTSILNVSPGATCSVSDIVKTGNTYNWRASSNCNGAMAVLGAQLTRVSPGCTGSTVVNKYFSVMPKCVSASDVSLTNNLSEGSNIYPGDAINISNTSSSVVNNLVNTFTYSVYKVLPAGGQQTLDYSTKTGNSSYSYTPNAASAPCSLKVYTSAQTRCTSVSVQLQTLDLNLNGSCFQDQPANLIFTPDARLATVSNTAYKLAAKNTNYTFRIDGVTDLLSNYTITDDGGSDMTFSCSANGSSRTSWACTVVARKDIGSYTVSFTKNAGIGTSCLDVGPLKFFIGGQDAVYTQPCIFDVVHFLTTSSADIINPYDINDLKLTYFTSTFTSSKAIIARPGLTLSTGAVLKLDRQPSITVGNNEANMNFISNKVFDDYGNTLGESRQYYNTEGKLIQTQYKLLDKNVIMASNMVYDRYGQASLATLSAPVYAGSNDRYDTDPNCPDETTYVPGVNIDFAYKSDFMENDNSTHAGPSTSGYTEYDFTHFDNGATVQTPVALKTTQPGTLGWYYSGNNTTTYTYGTGVYSDATLLGKIKEPLAPATASPYARTFYDDHTEDPLGSAGPNMNKGTSSVKMNQTSRQAANLDESVGLTATQVTGLFATYGQMWAEIFGAPMPAVDYTNFYRVKSTDINGKTSYAIFDRSDKAIMTYYLPTGTTSFSFYDNMSRLVVSVSPNGVKAYTDGTTAYANIDKTVHEYDYLGRTTAVTSNDGGRTELKCRKDGAIRFSQNALFRSQQRYSYTIYDDFNRSIETGVLSSSVSATDFASLSDDQLEGDYPAGDAYAASKNSVLNTYYDSYDNTNPPVVNGSTLQGDFLRGKLASTSKKGVSQTWYSYDERGRLIRLVQQLLVMGSQVKTIDYTYNEKGSVKEVAYQDGAIDAFYHYYTYNDDGGLKEAYGGTTEPTYNTQLEITNLGSLDKLAAYDYYLHGPLKSLTLGAGEQQINYTYTAEGWLKSINHPDPALASYFGASDKFSQVMNYYPGDYTKLAASAYPVLPASPVTYYNGIPNGLAWDNNGFDTDPGISSYFYTYDDKYQLASARLVNSSKVAQSQYSEEGINYDDNGNILGLQRYGATSGTLLHDFTDAYTYDNTTLQTNRLKGITGYASYTYNAIGQMTTQTQGTGTINYNYDVYNNLIVVINVGNGAVSNFLYDDRMQRIRTIKSTSNIPETSYFVRDASGNIMAVYDKNYNLVEVPIYGAQKLGSIRSWTTDASGTYPKYDYELTDHLGNVRVVYEKDMKTGSVANVEAHDYYPYGLPYQGAERNKLSAPHYRFGYQGQYAEYDDEIGLNHFDLREYNPVIGRWLTIDPKGQFFSPYIGMGNNPVIGYDIDGSWCPTCSFWSNLQGSSWQDKDIEAPWRMAGIGLDLEYSGPKGSVSMLDGDSKFTLSSQIMGRNESEALVMVKGSGKVNFGGSINQKNGTKTPYSFKAFLYLAFSTGGQGPVKPLKVVANDVATFQLGNLKISRSFDLESNKIDYKIGIVFFSDKDLEFSRKLEAKGEVNFYTKNVGH